jgi:type IV pilus assembly protein PilN
MIRINLIAPERTPQKKAKEPSAPGALQFYIFLFLFAGGSLGLCGFFYWVKYTQLNKLKADIAAAEKRQQELQAVKAQVDALEKKRDDYKRKVDLIDRLRKEQNGPVHLLDEISKALPDFVWLRTLDQAGNRVTMAGNSSTMNAVADFLSALQREGWFTQVEPGAITEDASGLVSFSITATFNNKELASAAAKPGGAPAPPAGGPR